MERAIDELGEGIQARKVHLEQNLVDVSFDESKILQEQIVSAIEDVGYDVEK